MLNSALLLTMNSSGNASIHKLTVGKDTNADAYEYGYNRNGNHIYGNLTPAECSVGGVLAPILYLFSYYYVNASDPAHYQFSIAFNDNVQGRLRVSLANFIFESNVLYDDFYKLYIGKIAEDTSDAINVHNYLKSSVGKTIDVSITDLG